MGSIRRDEAAGGVEEKRRAGHVTGTTKWLFELALSRSLVAFSVPEVVEYAETDAKWGPAVVTMVSKAVG